MKFWKRLRWIVSALFVVVLLLSWLGADELRGGKRYPAGELRQAPTFNH
jgi:hypothetical protein